MIAKMRQVISAEAKFVVGIITLAATIGVPFFGLRQDVALIQQSINTIQLNHSKHIEDIMVQLEKQNLKLMEHSEVLVLLIERMGQTK